MALSCQNRLRNKKIISLVSQKGALWKTPFFRFKFLPARNNIPQVVVMTSKKFLDKRAVQRNLARRRISGAIEEIGVANIPQCLIIIQPSERIFTVPYKELKKTLQFSFSKIQK